ncbi:ANTAR domain-containing protein [Mycobacterium sp. TY814]|uniref:ANTAR domain-containing protein n=1 Tax=unclassified Mycobacterium TaxID=2642494 RepID=UPI0027420C01|nr:ANTAR domain-containing protein [Mycobacterium sp. TY814]MDP7723904.1 ANTAR domain-containing protein [Mycobacterium sp. TY814]
MSEAPPDQLQTTRVIDTAVGILVGWRRCSTQSAFRELLSASERQQVPLFAMAGALVNLAGRHANAQTAGVAAERGAQREWGEEFLTEAGAAAKQRPVNRWL